MSRKTKGDLGATALGEELVSAVDNACEQGEYNAIKELLLLCALFLGLIPTVFFILENIREDNVISALLLFLCATAEAIALHSVSAEVSRIKESPMVLREFITGENGVNFGDISTRVFPSTADETDFLKLMVIRHLSDIVRYRSGYDFEADDELAQLWHQFLEEVDSMPNMDRRRAYELIMDAINEFDTYERLSQPWDIYDRAIEAVRAELGHYDEAETLAALKEKIFAMVRKLYAEEDMTMNIDVEKFWEEFLYSGGDFLPREAFMIVLDEVFSYMNGQSLSDVAVGPWEAASEVLQIYDQVNNSQQKKKTHTAEWVGDMARYISEHSDTANMRLEVPSKSCDTSNES